MLKKIYITILFLISVFPLYADWENCYFRGTPNGWGTSKMEKISLNLWKINVKFLDDDGSGGPRFKISRYENWTESYPNSDYKIDKYGEYEIIFNDRNKKIKISLIKEMPTKKLKMNWDNCYFRGTPNDWSCDEMVKTGNNLWYIVVEFNSKKDKNMRFKISRYKNWAESYPANDYKISTVGKYEITFNDETKDIVIKMFSGDNWENCYFRGTPNNWEVTPMKKVDDNTWSIVAKFSGGDKDGRPRFKISRYPDWSESYPAEDYRVEKESLYEIIFQSEAKVIYLKKLN